jgi:hypothetical protein
MKKSSVSINTGSGFSMAFANGIEISVQFSSMHYCENRHARLPFGGVMIRPYSKTYRHMESLHSSDAEVLIWKDGRDLGVMPGIGAETIGKLIGVCQSAESLEDVEKEIFNIK